MRCAISAAPALVKVRQRIEAGSTPDSRRRRTRAVSTCVFPVPAEAERAAWLRGSDALLCSPSSTWRGFTRALMSARGPAPHPRYRKPAPPRQRLLRAEAENGTG